MTLSTGPVLSAMNANGFSITPATYNVHVIWADPSNHALGLSLGCSPATDMASNGGNPYSSTDVLIVRRGTCARVAKAIYGQQAGAGAVVMVNTSTLLPPYEGPITSNPDTGLPYLVTIPFLGVTGGSNPNTSANGAALIAADGGTLALAANAGIANGNYKGLASFTSWGPSAGGNMKPEVTAPGVSIMSAGVGAGNGGVFLSGTSMAAPHTTGTAALVKQAHPSWGSVQMWKDAIENTANPANVANYAIRGAGAGEIDAYNATHTKVVCDGSPAGAASLNFGTQFSGKKVDVTKTIICHNTSSAKVSFLVSGTSKQGGAHTILIGTPNTHAPKKVYIKANSDAKITIELVVYKGKFADPVSAFNDWWGAGQFDDVAGLIHFAPLSGSNSGIALNVPYYTVPAAVSNVAVSGITSAAFKNGATNSNVTLTNPKGATGYADWFAWGGTSPVVGGIGSADLVNDGVTSYPDGSNTADSSSVGVFAVQTTQAWTNPAEDLVEVDVDVNNDTVPDYAVFAYDFGALSTGSYNGQSVVFVQNLHTGHIVFHYLTGAMFNGTTMELPFRFSDLCQSGAPCVTPGTAITYSTFTQDRNGGADAITNNKSFDVFQPSVLNNGSDTVGRNATVSDPTTLDPTAWAANPQLGIFVVMQNNQNTVGEAKTFSVAP
jgi:minor extracellular serine protease Vpr